MEAMAIDTAGKGDAVVARDLPGTVVAKGYGWVRTFDGLRSLYVCCDERGEVWTVREVSVLAVAKEEK